MRKDGGRTDGRRGGWIRERRERGALLTHIHPVHAPLVDTGLSMHSPTPSIHRPLVCLPSHHPRPTLSQSTVNCTHAHSDAHSSRPHPRHIDAPPNNRIASHSPPLPTAHCPQLDALLDLSNEQFVELVHCRARRRFNRGLTRKPKRLIEKLRKAKKEALPNEKPATVKTHLRDMIIVPEMIGSVVGIYNGKVNANAVFWQGPSRCILFSPFWTGRHRQGGTRTAARGEGEVTTDEGADQAAWERGGGGAQARSGSLRCPERYGAKAHCGVA